MSTPPSSDETVFAAALERPPAERAAFLDQACAGDPDRRARIDSLLRAHASAADFLESPPDALAAAAATKAGPPAEASLGDRIGRYKLLQKLGEGGCGTVYLAEQQEPVVRRVALKVIKLGMDTKEVIARFEAERQALALMDHPNIARVFDAGATAAGRPFFVMELVRGVPITKYCDEQNLSTANRLELFTAVCHAVQHAHQKGIIHRDLKPSNILVTLHDGRPVPKVIDFGIAKATQGRLTDATLFTAFEQFIGTPAYMSPEQAELSGLDIDTRSDIYSLGVLLYELLTGRPPFDPHSLHAAGLDEIRRIIREVDPPRPSTRLSILTAADQSTIAKQRATAPAHLSTILRGDLDWIVMRCLEKDRTRRYETASALAADLGRHLLHEPVLARPPSAGYRLQKFVRRHRFGVAAGSAVAASLLLGLGFATRSYLHERSARAAAAAARELAELRRTEAETMNRFLVSDLLGSVDPAVAQGRDITVKEVLQHATLRIDHTFRDNPKLAASLRATLGDLYRSLGVFDLAEKHLVAALDQQIRLLGPEHADTLATQRALGIMRSQKAESAEADALLRQTLAAQQRILGPEHEQTLRTANELCLELSRQGQSARFDAAGRKARIAEDETLALQTLEAARRRLGPDHLVSLRALHELGVALYLQRKLPEALAMSAEMLAALRRVHGPEHPETLSAMHDHAVHLYDAGQVEAALQLDRELMALETKVWGPDHQFRAQTMRGHSILLRQLNRIDEADPFLIEANAIYVRALGLENDIVIRSLEEFGLLFVLDQRAAEAAAFALERLPEAQKRLPADSPGLAVLYSILGGARLAEGRATEAESLLRQCLAIRSAKAADDWRRFNTESLLGAALLAQGKLREAEPRLLAGYEGLAQREAKISRLVKPSQLHHALSRLVQLYAAMEQPAQAAEWQRRIDALPRPNPPRPAPPRPDAR